MKVVFLETVPWERRFLTHTLKTAALTPEFAADPLIDSPPRRATREVSPQLMSRTARRAGREARTGKDTVVGAKPDALKDQELVKEERHVLERDASKERLVTTLRNHILEFLDSAPANLVSA